MTEKIYDQREALHELEPQTEDGRNRWRLLYREGFYFGFFRKPIEGSKPAWSEPFRLGFEDGWTDRYRYNGLDGKVLKVWLSKDGEDVPVSKPDAHLGIEWEESIDLGNGAKGFKPRNSNEL